MTPSCQKDLNNNYIDANSNISNKGTVCQWKLKEQPLKEQLMNGRIGVRAPVGSFCGGSQWEPVCASGGGTRLTFTEFK